MNHVICATINVKIHAQKQIKQKIAISNARKNFAVAIKTIIETSRLKNVSFKVNALEQTNPVKLKVSGKC